MIFLVKKTEQGQGGGRPQAGGASVGGLCHDPVARDACLAEGKGHGVDTWWTQKRSVKVSPKLLSQGNSLSKQNLAAVYGAIAGVFGRSGAPGLQFPLPPTGRNVKITVKPPRFANRLVVGLTGTSSTLASLLRQLGGWRCSSPRGGPGRSKGPCSAIPAELPSPCPNLFFVKSSFWDFTVKIATRTAALGRSGKWDYQCSLRKKSQGKVTLATIFTRSI